MRILKECLLILCFILLVVEVCYGGLNLQLMATMTGENEGNGLGGRVKGLGDINGDGCDDVAVSVEGYDDCRGRVNVYFGSSEFENIPDMILDGHGPREHFGISIAAGDVNGDQQNDIMVGATGYNSGAGGVYLYFGGALLDTIPDLIFEGPTGPSGTFAAFMSSAGDVNKDGFDEVIISAVNECKVYLYLGGENMDTVADAVFSEDVGSGLFGGSISSAGDVNGDGYDDIIVGSTHPAYIFWGGSNIDTIPDLILEPIEYGGQIVSAGDLNHDGYSDIITGGNHRTFFYYGSADPDTIFDLSFDMTGSISTGYFNNDSFCDALIGDCGSFGGLGSAWVLLGGNPMDSIPDWGVVGTHHGTLGASVSSAGDVNGDSIEDVIIGQPASGSGKAYVYKGDPSGVEDWDQPYQLPGDFELYQNFPNPFNATTLIRYHLPAISSQQSAVSLKIYNIVGEEMRTLVDKPQKGGHYEVTWDGKDNVGREVGSGIYFYQLRMETQKGGVAQKAKKLLLIR